MNTWSNRARLKSLFWFISDLVDALSAPIQFMSQAEKRAKQMQEMGIDASDITEISSSGASKSQLAAKKTPTATNGKLVPNSAQATQQSNSHTPSTQSAPSTEKKKGKIIYIVPMFVDFCRNDISTNFYNIFLI